jgi:hypothetical protein
LTDIDADALQHLVRRANFLPYLPYGSSHDLSIQGKISRYYLESFLLHIRVLLDFFEHSKRSVRRGNELDDVLVLDYGLPAEPIGIPQLLRQRLNQDLAHLSYSRTQRQGADRDWFPELMARPLLTRCDVFAKHLLKGAAPLELPDAGRARYNEIRQLVAALLQASEA